MALTYCNGYNSYNGYCNSGLSYGARAGIGIGIVVVVVLIMALVFHLSRRRRRARLAATGPQQGIPMSYQNNGPSNYYQGYNNGYAQPSPYGQNATPYGQQASPYGQQPTQTYAPPPGQPPASGTGEGALYGPPPGAPPPAYVPPADRKGAETAV